MPAGLRNYDLFELLFGRVMRGLGPRIHVFLTGRKTWMAGTSPAMTVNQIEKCSGEPATDRSPSVPRFHGAGKRPLVGSSHEIARDSAVPFAITDLVRAFPRVQASLQPKGIARA